MLSVFIYKLGVMLLIIDHLILGKFTNNPVD